MKIIPYYLTWVPDNLMLFMIASIEDSLILQIYFVIA